MTSPSIVLLGGGGHATVLIDLIREQGKFDISGLVDPALKRGETVSGVPVLGTDQDLPGLYEKQLRNIVIAVGCVKRTTKRQELFDQVSKLGFRVPPLIHPRASLASTKMTFEDGVQIMMGAMVQSGASIGRNTILNTGCVVEHEVRLGMHIHVCPRAVICAETVIGDGAFIGAGSTIIQGIRIGKNACIAAGAVVIRDVPDNATVRGVPGR